MKRLAVAASLAALGLASCQTGMSYADAQAACEAQGYRIGSNRFERCVDHLYRYPQSGTAITVGVVEDPVYVAPPPVVVGGYYGAPAYYGRRYYGQRYYGGPYYGGYYWR
jgi:hypothetical protein